MVGTDDALCMDCRLGGLRHSAGFRWAEATILMLFMVEVPKHHVYYVEISISKKANPGLYAKDIRRNMLRYRVFANRLGPPSRLDAVDTAKAESRN